MKNVRNTIFIFPFSLYISQITRERPVGLYLANELVEKITASVKIIENREFIKSSSITQLSHIMHRLKKLHFTQNLSLV